MTKCPSLGNDTHSITYMIVWHQNVFCENVSEIQTQAGEVQQKQAKVRLIQFLYLEIFWCQILV